MNCKKIVSLCAVFAMLLVGCACILGEGGITDASTAVPNADPVPGIYVDGNGKIDEKLLTPFKAEYDESTHTLTFNEDVKVTCSGYFIHTMDYRHRFNINVNAEIVISSIDGQNTFCGIQPHYVDIKGTGSITINCPCTTGNCYGIDGSESDIDSDGVSITINSPPQKCGGQYTSVELMNLSNLRIHNAALTIDNSGYEKNNDYDAAILFHGNSTPSSINMFDSRLEIKVGKIPAMIEPSSFQHQGGFYCESTTIDITGGSGAEMDLISIFNFGISKKSKLTMDIDCSGNCIVLSQGDGPAFSIDDSTADIRLNNVVNGITKKNDDVAGEVVEVKNNGLLSITGATNSAINTDKVEIKNGFLSVESVSGDAIKSPNISVTNSDVIAKSSTGKAFSSTFTPSGADMVWGSNDGKKPTAEITEAINTYSWIHIIVVQEIKFDLGEGKGMPVESIRGIVGDTITLPGSNAKYGNMHFVGWSDGTHVYKAGQTYTIGPGTTLVAVYEYTDITAIVACILTVIVSVFALLIVVIGYRERY